MTVQISQTLVVCVFSKVLLSVDFFSQASPVGSAKLFGKLCAVTNHYKEIIRKTREVEENYNVKIEM